MLRLIYEKISSKSTVENDTMSTEASLEQHKSKQDEKVIRYQSLKEEYISSQKTIMKSLRIDYHKRIHEIDAYLESIYELFPSREHFEDLDELIIQYYSLASGKVSTWKQSLESVEEERRHQATTNNKEYLQNLALKYLEQIKSYVKLDIIDKELDELRSSTLNKLNEIKNECLKKAKMI